MPSLPRLTNKNIFMASCLIIVAIIASWILFSKPLYPIVINSDGKEYNLRVELANTDQERERGLMYRDSLSPDKGMLFVFPKEDRLSFWMKNTLIPLDMLFIKPDGTIDFIHHNAKPMDETPITAPGPVIAVLEIGGGQADKHGVKVGDKIKTTLLTGAQK